MDNSSNSLDSLQNDTTPNGSEFGNGSVTGYEFNQVNDNNNALRVLNTNVESTNKLENIPIKSSNSGCTVDEGCVILELHLDSNGNILNNKIVQNNCMVVEETSEERMKLISEPQDCKESIEESVKPSNKECNEHVKKPNEDPPTTTTCVSVEPLDLTSTKESRKENFEERESSHKLLPNNPLHNITNLNNQKSPTGSVQKFLYWPDDNILQPKNKNRPVTKVKTPSVISGTQWQQIVENKQNEKRIKIEEATLKKKLKTEKQIKMKIEKEKIRIKRENEKFLTEQKQIEKERQKLFKQQQKVKEIEERNKAKQLMLLKNQNC